MRIAAVNGYDLFRLRPTHAMISINKTIANNIHMTELKSGHAHEFFVTALPCPGEDISAVFNRALDTLRNQGAEIIHQSVFIAHDGVEDRDSFNGTFGGVDWPVTCLMGLANKNNDFMGTEIHAIAGADVKRIKRNGVPVGSFFEFDNARFCRMGGILPIPGKSRTEQAGDAFRDLESGLLKAGMDFSCIGRTWIYLENLLEWYGPFNQARDAFFRKRDVFNKLLPASTGIGGPNPAGAALSMGALAVKGNGSSLHSVPSPHQDQAFKYGSSFSRAVEIGLSHYCLLLVSGTAGIDRNGRTVYVGDVEGQVRLTMKVVGAILESRGMTWDNVSRGIAYFRHAADTPLFKQFLAQNGLPSLPVVVICNEICRDDLLFELEVDAVCVRNYSFLNDLDSAKTSK